MSGMIKSIRSSFAAAIRGCLRAFHGERTFRIMVLASLIILTLVSVTPLSSSERLVLLLMTGLTLVLELLNTMIERLVDLLKPRLSSYVRDVKDLMAAAVLVASFFAFLIGLIIFYPHLALFIRQI